MSEPARSRDIDRARTGRAGLRGPGGPSRGFWGALATVDHKIIGRRYIATAFAFLFLGGVLALAMRWQLAKPENRASAPTSITRSSRCTART